MRSIQQFVTCIVFVVVFFLLYLPVLLLWNWDFISYLQIHCVFMKKVVEMLENLWDWMNSKSIKYRKQSLSSIFLFKNTQSFCEERNAVSRTLGREYRERTQLKSQVCHWTHFWLLSHEKHIWFFKRCESAKQLIAKQLLNQSFNTKIGICSVQSSGGVAFEEECMKWDLFMWLGQHVVECFHCLSITSVRQQQKYFIITILAIWWGDSFS